MDKVMIVCCGYLGVHYCEYGDNPQPINNFYTDITHYTGVHRLCKKCMGESNRRWRKKHNPKSNAITAKSQELARADGITDLYAEGITKDDRKRWGYRRMAKSIVGANIATLNSNVVDIQPKLKSEFGQSTPMTKRETIRVEGKAVPEGWVYILQNPACTKPWSLKIGKTFPDGLPDIISSARRFGRAELVGMYWFEEAYKAEQAVHTLLNHCNLRTLGYTDCGRELFKCTIQEAVNAITKVQSENDRPSIAVGE